MHAIVNRPVNLHGTGEESYLLVFRDDPHKNPAVSPHSDELRIYDIEKGRIRLAFDFQPENPQAAPYEFQLVAVKDFDRNDRPEILGSYTTAFMNFAVPHPVIIVWDEAAQKYRVEPLLSSPPKLTYRGDAGGFGQIVLEFYRKPAELVDPKTKIALRAYGTHDFAISTRRFTSLIAGFIVYADAHSSPIPPLFEIHEWRLNFQLPTPQVSECVPLDGKPVRTKPPRAGFVDGGFFSRVWIDQTRMRVVSCA
jgi:hypothetical protein